MKVITLMQNGAGLWGYVVTEGGRVTALEQPGYDDAQDALQDALDCPTPVVQGE